MRKSEIIWPVGAEVEQIAQSVERCALEQGLVLTLRDTLRSYPGSIHWHWKRGQERGVLEITLWPQANCLWFSVQAGRTAGWIDALLPILHTSIVNAIAGESHPAGLNRWVGTPRHPERDTLGASAQ